MAKQGKNLQIIKEDNKSLVLKLICTGLCTTRMEISTRTGLTKMTVTNIINELMAEGWICEGNVRVNNGPGRKAKVLLVKENSKASIGIYLSRDFICVSLITADAQIIKTVKYTMGNDETAESITDKFFEGISHVCTNNEIFEILGIGVAAIGPLKSSSGTLLSPLDFFGIKDFRIKDILEEKTGLPVTVNNDMNAGALAELLYGHGKTCSDFIYFGITHGIGCGIVLNSDLYTGSLGYSGEFGHLSIDFNGPLCSCNNRGCIEMYASVPNFMKKVATEAKKSKNSRLSTSKVQDYCRVFELARSNDPLASKLVDEYIHQVGSALISLIHLLDTPVIFLGHEAALAGEWFAAKLQKHLRERCMFDESDIKVGISKFNDSAPVVGSGILIFDLIFRNKF